MLPLPFTLYFFKSGRGKTLLHYVAIGGFHEPVVWA